MGSTLPGSSGTYTATESKTGTNLAGTYSIVAGTGFTKLTVASCAGGGCPVPTSLVGVQMPASTMILQPILGEEQQPIFNLAPGACPTGKGRIFGNFVPTQWPAGGVGTDVTSTAQIGLGSAEWNMATANPTLTIRSRRNLVNYGELGAVPMPHGPCGATGTGEVTLTGEGDRGGTLTWMQDDLGFFFRSKANHSFWFIAPPTFRYPGTLYGNYSGFSFDPAGAADVKPLALKVVTAGTSGSGNAVTDVTLGTTDQAYLRTFTIPSTAGVVNGVTYPAGGGINFPFNGMVSGTISDGASIGNLTCLVLASEKGTYQNALYCSGQSPGKNSLPYNLVVVMNVGVPGTFDSTFGTNGTIATSLFPAASTETMNVALPQADGRTVLLGCTTSSGTSKAAAARLGVDGKLETSFGSNGIVETTLSDSATDQCFQRGVLQNVTRGLQSEEEIVGIGYSTVSGKSESAVARFRNDGTLDTAFDSNGKWNAAFGVDNQLIDAKLQADGKIAAVGYLTDATTGLKQPLALRLTASGALDTTFGGGKGYVTYAVGSASAPAIATALDLQANGAWVVGGQCSRAASGIDFCVGRLDTSGAPDLAFGEKGIAYVALASGGGDDLLASLKVTAAGKILLGGSVEILKDADPFKSKYDLAMARLNSDGTLDKAFNNAGALVVPIGTGNNQANTLQIESSGKLVLAGTCADPTLAAWQFCALRTDADGRLDTTLGSNGTLTGQIGGQSTQLRGLSIDPEGRYLMTGTVLSGGRSPAWQTLLMRHWQ